MINQPLREISVQANIKLVEIMLDLMKGGGVNQDTSIERILQWACANIGIYAVAVFQRSPSGTLIRTHHSGVNPVLLTPPQPSSIPIDSIPHLDTENLSVLRSNNESDPGLLCQALLPNGTGTLALVSVSAHGQPSGVISFGSLDDSYVISDEKHQIMVAIAELISTIIGQSINDASRIEVSENLSESFEAIQNLVFEVDAEGRCTNFVAGPEKMGATPTKSLIGKTISDLLPVYAAEVAQKALAEIMAAGRAREVHYRTQLPDGPHDFELSGARKAANDTDGKPTAIFLVRDVTRESSLRQELRHLGKIVEVMDNLVAITDVQQKVVWVNAAFERQTGWTLDEIRGKDLAALVRCNDSDPAVIAKVSDAISAKATFKGEIVNVDRYGKQYWVDFNIWPYFEGNGDFKGYVSVETVVSRLKEQETAMRELADKAAAAQTRLENALMALPDGVVVLDAEERVIAVNGAYHQTFPEIAEIAVPGAKLTDLLRAGFSKGLFHSETANDDIEGALQRRLEDYRQQKHVDEVQLPNGKWLRRISMRTSDGGCIAVGIDITATKRHLSALDAVNNDLVLALQDRDAARQRLIRILDGVDIGTWEWNISSDCLKVGGRWGEIIGYDTRTIACLSSGEFRSFVHPDDLKIMDSSREVDFSSTNEVIAIEFRMRHREGHWVWILSRSRVTERTPDGRASILAGVHLDISDRKRLEQELLTSETYLSLIMETNVAAVAVLTEEGIISFANAEAERVLGLPRTQIIGRHFCDPLWNLQRIDGSLMPDEELPFSMAISETVPVRDIRFAIHWPNGMRRLLSCNAAKLSVIDGKMEVVTTFSDITDQVAATARLEDALSRAEELSRSKSRFLANMSHEIRTPLNGVLGMAEVLESLVKEPGQKRMIQTIRKSGDTLLTVLNGILDMSKIEAGKMALESVPFSPSEMARQLEAIYAIQAEEKGLKFEFFSTVGCDKTRLGDPHRINQILSNLLNNAIKFTEHGSVQMKMSCRPGKPFVTEISDTGIGMDERQVSRVFESFEQADGSTTRRFGGTGLGLSIVRQLVNLMGGEISVTTKAAAGTRIRVTLPLAESEPPAINQSAESAQPASNAPLSGVRLLYADDNQVNLLVLREMLSRTDAIITEVENGQQAVDAWRAAMDRGQPFSVVLLDITMPVRDGLSALAEIRETEAVKSWSSVPAIAVTANVLANQVTEYIVAGFTSHLAKPFRQSDLLHALHTVLAIREEDSDLAKSAQ